jgi:hypothetical protein
MEILESVATFGWGYIESLACDDGPPLLSIINTLRGSGRSITDEIVLRSPQPGGKHYSDIYGTGMFPFHTDFAFERIPPRYVILICIGTSSDRPTILCRPSMSALSFEDEHVLVSEIWQFNTGRARVLGRLLDSIGGRKLFRVDPIYMSPFMRHSGKGRDIIRRLVSDSKKILFSWSFGDVLIFDNWACLHARGEAVDQSPILVDRRFRRTRIYPR